MNLKCIVGLGNPGAQYLDTRHNVGFRVLDLVAQRESIPFQIESKWESRVAKIGNVWLLQPLTYMNASGRAVGSLARFYRWQPEEILVVYDDISLPLGHLRFRMNGGHGGHNGIRSLIDHLQSERFPRLKLGIHGASGDELVGHVLGKFAPDERVEAENMLARAAEAVQFALPNGLEQAANQFNTKNLKQTKNQIEDNEPEIRGTDRPEHPGNGEEH